MYKNTGDKINNWAVVIAFFEIFGSILLGAIIIFLGMVGAKTAPDPDLFAFASFVVGIAVGVRGSLTAWRKHLLLAGFGELIDKTCEISEDVAKLKEEQKAKTEEPEQPAVAEKDCFAESDEANLEIGSVCVPKWKILRQCLDQGLITEEEYEKKMQELYK